MQQTLDLERLSRALAEAGLSQAGLAQRLGLSREAVSKWFAGESFPRPEHVMQIALAVGLRYDQFVREALVNEPVVAFRRKGASKTTEAHVGRARSMGVLLERLVPNLPFEQLTQHPTLRAPVVEYEYLQRAAREIRRELGVGRAAPLSLDALVKHFQRFPVVLVPVLWGERPAHEHALHVQLPKSNTTWIYLNLDSRRTDFLFWAAHELGHVISPTLRGDEAEQFADAFAGALLFPHDAAAAAYTKLARLTKLGVVVNELKSLADAHGISPITVYEQVSAYAESQDLRPIGLPKKSIYPAATEFAKTQPTMRELLFGKGELPSEAFIRGAETTFKTPFFQALRAYLTLRPSDSGYVQAILNTTLLDAKSVAAALV